MAVVKQIIRHKRKDLPKREIVEPKKSVVETYLENLDESDIEELISAKKNKKTKKQKDMTNEKISIAEELVQNLTPETVKVVKKDRGLIERTESSKIVVTEDNRQVLND